MRRMRASLTLSAIGGLGLWVAAQSAASTASGGWAETVLQHFGNGGDGGYPAAGLTLGPGGAVYGTTPNGGARGFGTVYALAPANGGWQMRVLYSFAGGGDGAHPMAGVALAADGTLYGTTLAGGAAGQGTVFELRPSGRPGAWSERVVYAFSGGGDGAQPVSGLARDAAGSLYGTTLAGGAHARGTVFRLTPQPAGGWTQSVLYSFADGHDGALPFAAVVFDGGGALCGTTSYGGAHGFGTVFRLAPPAAGSGWTETVLYSFTGKDDGGLPRAGVIADRAGVLYGTTRWGGAQASGTAFELRPPASPGGAWREIVLHSFGNGFSDGADGGAPVAGVIFDPSGGLYGTTNRGGAHGQGTVFQLSPPDAAGTGWRLAVLHSFAGTDGEGPTAGVILNQGKLFGTTFRGGAHGGGTVFELSP